MERERERGRWKGKGRESGREKEGTSALGTPELRLTRSMRKNARGAHLSAVADARQMCTVEYTFEYTQACVLPHRFLEWEKEHITF